MKCLFFSGAALFCLKNWKHVKVVIVFVISIAGVWLSNAGVILGVYSAEDQGTADLRNKIIEVYNAGKGIHLHTEQSGNEYQKIWHPSQNRIFWSSFQSS